MDTSQNSEPTELDENAEQMPKEEELLQSHPEQWETFKNIVGLIEEVRRCWTAAEYRAVQQHLAEYIDRVDAAVGDANKRCKKALRKRGPLLHKRMLANADEQVHIEAQLAKIEEEVSKATLDRKLYLRLGIQYRTVGDALAWQLYAFQAVPLFAFGQNQSPGMETKLQRAGPIAEIPKIDELWNKRKAFALRHHYTNCLRVYDLSIFDEDRPDMAETEEIKNDPDKHIPADQRQKGQIASALVQYGICTQKDGTLLIHLAQPHTPVNGAVSTNLDLLMQALSQAKEASIGYASNTYLTLTVVDLTNPANRPLGEMIDEWYEKTNVAAVPDVWKPLGIYSLVGYSTQKVTRSGHSGFGVPYTVYPLASDYAAALVTGYIRVHYQLNTAAIVQALRSAGFEVENLKEQQYLKNIDQSEKDSEYFRVRQGNVTLTIGDVPIRQMLFEGLPLEYLIESVRDHFKASYQLAARVEPTPDSPYLRRFQTLATYPIMESVWYSSRSYILPLAAETDENE